jgi:hypothetical protein
MPQIIEYSTVLESLTGQGLKSLYHNSGAFGFAEGTATISRGWIGPMDPSIRESARSLIRQVPLPHEPRLAHLLIDAWQQFLPGVVWVMPKSHWAYELEFGSRDWLPGLLDNIGIDSGRLLPLNNGAAIEFSAGESALLELFAAELLTRLLGSDFQAVFAGNGTICTIHQQGQLWWTSTDAGIVEKLDQLLSGENANVQRPTSNVQRRNTE